VAQAEKEEETNNRVARESLVRGTQIQLAKDLDQTKRMEKELSDKLKAATAITDEFDRIRNDLFRTQEQLAQESSQRERIAKTFEIADHEHRRLKQIVEASEWQSRLELIGQLRNQLSSTEEQLAEAQRQHFDLISVTRSAVLEEVQAKLDTAAHQQRRMNNSGVVPLALHFNEGPQTERSRGLQGGGGLTRRLSRGGSERVKGNKDRIDASTSSPVAPTSGRSSRLSGRARQLTSKSNSTSVTSTPRATPGSKPLNFEWSLEDNVQNGPNDAGHNGSDVGVKRRVAAEGEDEDNSDENKENDRTVTKGKGEDRGHERQVLPVKRASSQASRVEKGRGGRVISGSRIVGDNSRKGRSKMDTERPHELTNRSRFVPSPFFV
jgi:hypothetical protein